MNFKMLCFVAAITPAFVAPASAHHSFAMFDRSKTVTIAATVKELDLVNPHSWLQVSVTDAQGQVNSWSLEMGGAGQIARMGWDAQTVKAGDKITVNIHPLRDGSYGGQLVSATLADGKTLGQFGGGPGGFRPNRARPGNI